MTRTRQSSGLSTALISWLAAGVVATIVYPDSTVIGKAVIWGVLLPGATLGWLHWQVVMRRAVVALRALRAAAPAQSRNQARYIR